jgi:hypothetical protein
MWAAGVVMGVLVSMATQSLNQSTPDADPMIAALRHHATLAARSDPEAADERRHVEVYIAATYRSLLENEQLWINPLMATKLAPHRVAARQILSTHPTVQTNELNAATAALGPFLKEQDQERKNARDRAAFVPRIAPVVIASLMLGMAGVCGVVLAIVFRGGVLLRVFGLAVVDRRGRQASRIQAGVRALVAWTPAFVFVYLVFRTRVLFRDWAYTVQHPGATTAVAIAAVVFVGGALIAAFRRSRSIQDGIAGTFVVPR